MPVPDFILELRKHIGHMELWLPGCTAVVRREDEILLVRRSDNGKWAPVTGVVDPGEDPGAAAKREVMEETGVLCTVDRLARVAALPPGVHVNGDRTVYLDHTFACTYVSGEAYVGDDESLEVRWSPLDALPPMDTDLLERIEAATSGEVATRFLS